MNKYRTGRKVNEERTAHYQQTQHSGREDGYRRLVHLVGLVLLTVSIVLSALPVRAVAQGGETLAIYLASATGSSSQHFMDMEIESKTQIIAVYIPETGESAIIDKNIAPDWAPSKLYLYGLNGRIYIQEVWRELEPSSSHMDVQELNPVTLQKEGTAFSLQDHPSQRTFSIVGSKAYYRRYSSSRGGGQFAVFNFSDPNAGNRGQVLLDKFHPDNSAFNNYFSDNGNLYSVYSRYQGDQADFSRRDLTTGVIIDRLGSITFPDVEQYNWAAFDVSDDAAYIVRTSEADQRVAVCRWDFVNDPELLFSDYVFDESVPSYVYMSGIDVEDGYVLLYNAWNDVMVFFDSEENYWSKIETGLTPYDAAIVYQPRPDLQNTGTNPGYGDMGYIGYLPAASGGGGGGCSHVAGRHGTVKQRVTGMLMLVLPAALFIVVKQRRIRKIKERRLS